MEQAAVAAEIFFNPDGNHIQPFHQSPVFDLLPFAIYTCNVSGLITNYNKKAVELWGRAPVIGDAQERFNGAFKLYYPDGTYLPHNQTPVAASLIDGLQRNNIELIMERPDGSRISACITITPIKDESGKVLGMINCFYDCTEQKQTSNALARKTKELQDFVDNASIGLHWVNRNGIITWANKAELDMLGYSEEEYVGHHISEFHKDAEKIEDILKRLDSDETVINYESYLRCKDGSFRNVQISSNVFRENGKFIHTRCFTIDITEQKKLNQAVKASELKEKEERYHKMIDEVEDYAIVLLDKEGIIQNWNRGAEKIKGYKEKEIVGKNFRVFYLEDDRKSGLPDQLLATARNKGKAIHEGWRVRNDGTAFWGSIVITALHDADHNIIGFSKVTRDLTERKSAEDKLRDYTNQLEFQNQELEQFAYAASHDMKEPLRKISFYNHFVLDEDKNRLTDKSREYLNRSVAAVKRMNELIEDLLTYSKTNALQDNYEETDLKSMVEDIILSHKDLLEPSGSIIEIGELPVIPVIPFQFRQLMDNLLNNAIKYKHPTRQLVIRISYDKVKGKEIENKAADPRLSYNRISVEDNGIGFDDQYSEKIFEIFQRLSNQSGYRGSGIGLAICKKIAQNHRGFIKAIGVPDKGARFEIYIPDL